MKKASITLVISCDLSACGSQTPENADTEKRIAVCEEVMKLYIVEAKTYERDRKRLVGSCHISQKDRTLEQWQCALIKMQEGTAYVAASDQCGKSGNSGP